MKIKVVELFAGVGGFRVGLNNIKLEKDKVIEKSNFDFVWMNQWEPSTKTQHAFNCYVHRFGSVNKDGNTDISLVDKNTIPNHDLLCGGFPCQDYSVAHSLSKAKGIKGKKGVLWWQINEILKVKTPKYVLLENVDRLLKSPAKQRGRDFGIILKCLCDLNYIVEWRVINAAEYGMPQRRKRTFIFAYKKSTNFGKFISKLSSNIVVEKEGIFARAFPIYKIEADARKTLLNKYKNLVNISKNFKFDFKNSGLMIEGEIYTFETKPVKVKSKCLSSIVQKNVEKFYYLKKEEISKFKYLRGHKRILRKSPNGKTYFYSEGAISSYDSLSLPGRTMLTSEGTINRSTHIILDPQTNKLRYLTPVECERLNMFPDNWTKIIEPLKRRYFVMGNALVCGIISKLGIEIKKIVLCKK